MCENMNIEKQFIMTEVAMISDIYSFGDELITEGVLYSVTNKISEFFQKAVNTMIAFVKTFKADLESTIQKKDCRRKLKYLKKDLADKKESGVKFVEMPDYKAFIKYYDMYSGKMTKLLGKISDKKYKTRSSLDTAMNEFESCLYDMNTALEKTLKNRIKVPIKDAIIYVDQNLNGQSIIEKRFLKVVHDLKEIGIKNKKIFKNINVSEDKEVLQKKTSMIRTIVSKISSTVSKWFRKFVMTIVFFFA